MNLIDITTNILIGIKNTICLPEYTKPIGVVYEVTDRCNSHCLHCQKWKLPSIGTMSLNQILNTFEDPLFSNVRYIILTGGEIFTRADISDIVLLLHCVLPNATLLLSTNGLLPEEVIHTTKLMIQKNIKFSIGTSLDGLENEHDIIRGTKGNYTKVIMMLTELRKLQSEYCFDLSVGFVLSEHTTKTYQKTQDHLFQMLGLSLYPQWYDVNPFYGNCAKEINSQEHLDIVQQMHDSPRKDMWLSYLRTGKINLSCYAMKTFFLLRSNGNITPCLTHSKVSAGNVLNTSPSEIWTCSKARHARHVVNDCSGCLNSWGVEWSLNSNYFPILKYELTRKLRSILKHNK